jgi:hypothetical protein
MMRGRIISAVLFLATCVAALVLVSCKLIIARDSVVTEDRSIHGTNRIVEISPPLP